MLKCVVERMKELIVGQAKLLGVTFDVVDFSLKEAVPERDWLAKTRTAIFKAEVFIVIFDSKTKSAPGVLNGISLADELQEPKFQIISYRE